MRAFVSPRWLLFAAAAIVAGLGCGRAADKPSDGGVDTPADVGRGEAAAGGSGGDGAGDAGGVSGVGAAAGSAGGGAGGAGGAVGAGGSAGAAGTVSGAAGTGAGTPLFPCIEDWPARPAGGAKAAPLAVQPGILWTKALPSSTAAAPIARGMAVTGSGVAFSSGYTLLVYDGNGGLAASVPKPQMGSLSSPVAGQDGSLYFADSMAAYRVDGTGQPIWQKPFGANQTSGNGAPRAPVLDPSGRLHISAMDGNLWTFRASDGQVLSSISLGLWHNVPRYINIGFGKVLVVDRSGIAAAGAGIDAYGLMSADGGNWLGEVTGQGLYIIAGYDLGVLVARGIDTYDLSVYDNCGNFRWRVPGSYAVPLAITFDDDLIVMDRTPTGAPSPNDYSFALRRFSKDGALRAGPVPVADQFCGNSFVGADDTFYYVGITPSGPNEGYWLRAFDASLNEKWVIPFPSCPDAAVLADGGKIFAARIGSGIAAVQTTSPGPAMVSWAQLGRDARATRWLAP